jgi:ATP-dependent Clp protease ATP-binding subunit ClpC
MTMQARDRSALAGREQELVALRRLAEELASQRGQKPTTTHLLAAIASGRDAGAQLLLERRLDADVALRAARITLDDAPDAIVRAIQKARELAARAGARGEPGAVHLLFALCQEGGTAAHRAMVQCGIDVTRLRTSAMQLAMGIAPPRRTTLAASAKKDARPSGIVPVGQKRDALTLTPMPTPIPSTTPSAAPKSTPSSSPMSTTGGSPRPIPAPPAKPSLPRPPSPRPSEPKASEPRPTEAKRHAHAHKIDARARRPKDAAKNAERFALDPKKLPLLAQLGQNLTELAAKGALDPVVGRDAEIERTLDVLAKRHANNAALVGAPGVGKTSVVRGLAQRIADGAEGVACFEDKIVVAIEPAAMLA